ncbi:hypothetical protein AMECASPLE_020930, partial [Ameca splendens]
MENTALLLCFDPPPPLLHHGLPTPSIPRPTPPPGSDPGGEDVPNHNPKMFIQTYFTLSVYVSLRDCQREEEFIIHKPLNGRWRLYKASGGVRCCQRKLTVIPMDAEDYSGQQLRSASNNGNVVLLVPFQKEIDTEPLPFDAEEFSRMPQ